MKKPDPLSFATNRIACYYNLISLLRFKWGIFVEQQHYIMNVLIQVKRNLSEPKILHSGGHPCWFNRGLKSGLHCTLAGLQSGRNSLVTKDLGDQSFKSMFL